MKKLTQLVKTLTAFTALSTHGNTHTPEILENSSLQEFYRLNISPQTKVEAVIKQLGFKGLSADKKLGIGGTEENKIVYFQGADGNFYIDTDNNGILDESMPGAGLLPTNALQAEYQKKINTLFSDLG